MATQSGVGTKGRRQCRAGAAPHSCSLVSEVRLGKTLAKQSPLPARTQRKPSRPELLSEYLFSVPRDSALRKHVPGRVVQGLSPPLWALWCRYKKAENCWEGFGVAGLSFQGSNSTMQEALGAAAVLSFPVKQSSGFLCSLSTAQQQRQLLHSSSSCSILLHSTPRLFPHSSAVKHKHPAVFLPSFSHSLPSLLLPGRNGSRLDHCCIPSLVHL